MKTERNILIAFLLNIVFSIIELVGGIITNSISIISDAIHDFGDALSIGISFILERVSKRKPDKNYTYGYQRYSVLGAFITTVILTVGSIFVIINGIKRIIDPVVVNYNGMILLSVLGIIINFLAAFFTKGGHSLNQKAVNLHMLEDVLGWVVVFIGAILIKFTDFYIIDSIISICIALFILVNSFENLKEILDLFLEKTPSNINVDEIKKHLLNIKGVVDVHHIHIWSIDGVNNYATMHVVSNEKKLLELKKSIKNEMSEHGISHTTIEIENEMEECLDKECDIKECNVKHHHHHH